MSNLLHKIIISVLFLVFFSNIGRSLSVNIGLSGDVGFSSDSITEIRGSVLDLADETPLPYANILVLHKNIGTISNEKGEFSLNAMYLDYNDTIRFQYIGYNTITISVGELLNSPVVNLQENIINLSETVVFGNAPDPVSIVKKIIQYKDSNYIRTSSKNQTFIRDRNIADIEEFSLEMKKSSFDQLNDDTRKLIENSLPKNTTSYSDYLCDLYFSEDVDDSIPIKVFPIRAVSLKEEEIAGLQQLETIFTDVFANTKDDEYWKIKSGILSQKIDIEEGGETRGDTTIENSWKVISFAKRMKYRIEYSTFNDKDDWEFLYKTGRYNYTLVGGTSVQGENVYIIDFEPGNSGNFIGRMYVSMNTYALIRADYEYAPDKTGTDIHLFGIGYTENGFSGSIYFERKKNQYKLKYFTIKESNYVSFDRNLALLKKKERFLFDKKQDEVKVGVNLVVNSEDSFEYLVIDGKNISQNDYNEFEQSKHMEVIYVDQFNDKLWEGFSIIEPTKHMREYKKQEKDFMK
jgi:carboxypeptidase-like protein